MCGSCNADFQNKTTFAPGGLQFIYHLRRYIGPAASHSGRGTNGRRSVPVPAALRRYYSIHHNTTCNGLPLIPLEASSRTKWRVLCAVVPHAWHERCRSMVGTAWPRTQTMAAVHDVHEWRP